MIVQQEGYSMVMLSPENDDEHAWLEESTNAEGWQWLGRALVLDARCAGPVIEGARDAGFEVTS